MFRRITAAALQRSPIDPPQFCAYQLTDHHRRPRLTKEFRLDALFADHDILRTGRITIE